MNSRGDLIGINTAIYSNGYYDRGNQGVGLQYHQTWLKVMSDLINHGEVVRSYIGVQIQPINDTAAKALDLKSRSGALVASVIEDGPADKAGIETGDVITEFNGIDIESVDHLRNNVSSSKPDKFYNLSLIRNGKKKSFRVKLAKMPSDDEFAINTQTEEANELGIEVSSLDKMNRQEFSLKDKDTGVLLLKCCQHASR